MKWDQTDSHRWRFGVNDNGMRVIKGGADCTWRTPPPEGMYELRQGLDYAKQFHSREEAMAVGEFLMLLEKGGGSNP